jgi:flavin reductase (DIM6/NTAB) family NADH-FMN oxidoreductase RutF
MGMKSLKVYEGLYPAPVALLVTQDCEGHTNVMAVAWAGVVCSNPPQISVSITANRHTYQLLRERGEFVVSIPSEAQLWAVDYCGCVSGKNVDKFAEAGLTKVSATKVSPPLIAECPVNLECVLRVSLSLGDYYMFIGEVVAVHADESVLDEKGQVDYGRANPVVYTFGQYWSLGKQVGRYGFSLKKDKVPG